MITQNILGKTHRLMETNKNKTTRHIAYTASFKEGCDRCGKGTNNWWGVNGRVICDKCYMEELFEKQ